MLRKVIKLFCERFNEHIVLWVTYSGTNPMEVKMLSEETFRHYLIRVTIAITHHIADPNPPFHETSTEACCLLSGLSQKKLLSGYRHKYQRFIETRNVGEYTDYANKTRDP